MTNNISRFIWKRFLEAARNDEGHVGKRQQRIEAAGHRHVTLPPDRIELGLESTQTIEIVEGIAVLEGGPAKLVPERRHRTVGKAGQRRHAEAEGRKAGRLEVQQHPREQQLHGAVGRLRHETHQVDRRLPAVARDHQRRKGKDAPGLFQHRDRLRDDIVRIESAHREGLFPGLASLQPTLRYGRQLFDNGRHALRRDHFENNAVTLGFIDGIAQIAAPGALDVKGGEIDHSLFAELEGGKSGIGIKRQAFGPAPDRTRRDRRARGRSR